MKVANEYLPFLFEGDVLYTIKEEGDANTYQAVPEEKPPIEALEPKETMQKPMPTQQTGSKPVLVLVDNEFTEAEKETLLKLLTAIQVKEQHFEIIKEHPENIKSLSSLKLFLSFHKDFVKSEIYEIHHLNTTRVIYAHNLNALNKDAKKKVQLWNLLKTIVK